jgi:hypothetical protein
MSKRPVSTARPRAENKRKVILFSVAGALFVGAAVLYWLNMDRTPRPVSDQAAADAEKVVETIKQNQPPPKPEPPPIPESERGSGRRPKTGR